MARYRRRTYKPSTPQERKFSKVIRAAAGLSGTPYPIEIIHDEADLPPTLRGESYHWETPSGRRVYHPSAYCRAARNHRACSYVGSTLRIEVGIEFIEYLQKTGVL